jgi:hypothetical protein
MRSKPDVRLATPQGIVGGVAVGIVVGILALATVPSTPSEASVRKPRFVCTQIMGVSVTGDWFGAGFEKAVGDETRWQAVWRKHAFVELWGNPRDPVWMIAPESACTKDADSPDRILFTAVNWEYKTADEWTRALTQAVEVIKTKYRRAKRIELLTMLRGPGNKSCGDPRTVVAPYIDEAVARVVAAFPKLVQAAPKFEAPSCAVFTKGGPHFTQAAMAEVARVYAAHYKHN